MKILSAALLGVLQGFSEFLPISSSGHLVIAQSLIEGFEQPGVLFDVFLHLATSFAIIIYFRNKIRNIDFKYLVLIVVGSLPAFIFGFLFRDNLIGLFKSVRVVGVGLIVTSILNFSTDRFYSKRTLIGRIDAFIIGFFQAFAIIPGVSRSGSTIFAGTYLGIEREKSAYFSFLLSIPAIFGASVYELISYTGSFDGLSSFYFVGFLAAFLSSLVAINFVLRFLNMKLFKIFSLYTFILGLLAIFVF